MREHVITFKRAFDSATIQPRDLPRGDHRAAKSGSSSARAHSRSGSRLVKRLLRWLVAAQARESIRRCVVKPCYLRRELKSLTCRVRSENDGRPEWQVTPKKMVAAEACASRYVHRAILARCYRQLSQWTLRSQEIADYDPQTELEEPALHDSSNRERDVRCRF